MRQAKLNLAAVLIVALPVAAVLASVSTAIIAVTLGDRPLPGQYHWEGDKLDHDFAQSERAEQLHLNATLNLSPDKGGICHLTLALAASNAPPSLDVALIHVSNPALDRNVRFMLSAASAAAVSGPWAYVAPCTALPPARWHLELSDPQRSWSFRSAIVSPHLQAVTLSSRSPADNPT